MSSGLAMQAAHQTLDRRARELQSAEILQQIFFDREGFSDLPPR
jgi:hypothetical protein